MPPLGNVEFWGRSGPPEPGKSQAKLSQTPRMRGKCDQSQARAINLAAKSPARRCRCFFLVGSASLAMTSGDDGHLVGSGSCLLWPDWGIQAMAPSFLSRT